jgi:hypothetical protein
VLLCILAVTGLLARSYYLRKAERELAEVVAELDRTDPHWRLHEIEATREVIPEEQNSARHVLAAAKHLGLNPLGETPLPFDEETGMQKPDFQLPPFEEPVESMHQYLQRIEPRQRYSDDFAKLLSEELRLHEAALLEGRKLIDWPRRGRYPVTYAKDLLSTPLPHAQDVRNLATVLGWEAALAAHDGNTDRSLVLGRSAVPLARTLGDDPSSICCLVRIAVVALGTSSIERTLAQGVASAAELQKTQQLLELELQECPESLTAAMRGERGMFFQVGEGLATGQLGTIWLERLSAGKSGAASNWYQKATDWAILRVYARRGQIIGLESLTRMVESTRLPPAEQLAAFDKFEAEAKTLRVRAFGDFSYLLPALMLPAIHKVGMAHLKGRSHLGCAVAGLAAERYRLKHGRWPETLEALVPEFLDKVPNDTLAGRSVVLKRLEDGILIYAVGLDRVDDGGHVQRYPPQVQGVDIGFRLWNPDQRRQPQPKPPAGAEDQP